MPVNQLYHDRGVALTRARGSDSEPPSDEPSQGIPPGHSVLSGCGEGGVDPIAKHDRFEIFRADEVRVSSTQFSGGDWHWRLADFDGDTLVEGAGYRTERACLRAVALLRDRAFSAS